MTCEPEETPKQEYQAYLNSVMSCIVTLIGCTMDDAKTYIGSLIEQTNGGTDVKQYSHEVPMYWATRCLAGFIKLNGRGFLDDLSSAARKRHTYLSKPLTNELIQDIRKIIEDHGGLLTQSEYLERRKQYLERLNELRRAGRISLLTFLQLR